MFDVYPLAYTKVDWAIFNKVVQDALGYSPTRGLDAAGIDLKDFQSYLAALDMENDPVNALKYGNIFGTYKHVHFSFITITTMDIVAELRQAVDVYFKIILEDGYKTDSGIAILTASMEQWQCMVLKYCNMSINKNIRAIAGRILNQFEKLGFKEVWGEYTKQTLNDKTFILVRR